MRAEYGLWRIPNGTFLIWCRRPETMRSDQHAWVNTNRIDVEGWTPVRRVWDEMPDDAIQTFNTLEDMETEIIMWEAL